MPTPSRIFAALMALTLATTIAGAAFAASSASIEQVRNGQATATTTPTPVWASGNAGASNSHYLESHSIAYRTVMDGLPTDGTVIELIIGYNIKRSGSYALDYLTHYQRLLPHVLFGHRDPEVFDPLSGVSGVSGTVTTASIPVPTRNQVVDPDGAESDPAAAQPATSMAGLAASERMMTLFGGTLIDVTYVSEGDPALATASAETQVKVRFTADSPKAVLAWGGHIASRWDWGFNANGTPRSAGGISGSSYHMRLVDWTLGNLGNQDRSMSTDAVYPVPRCAISNPGPFCAGSTNTHTAPAGMESYAWTLFDNTSGAAIVGSDTGPSVVVHAGTAGSYGLMVTTGASGFTKQCQATVTVNAPIEVNAGEDFVVCASAPQAQLAGVVVGGTGTWSGGAGSFSPGSGSLGAVYTPTAGEVAAGGVTLTLTGRPTSGPCPPISDQVRITIAPAATASAGPDQTLCASSPQVQLAGAVGGGASSGTWTGGAGSFNPSAAVVNAIYTPTAQEVASGGLTLTLTSNDPQGPCGPIGDDVRLIFLPAATAEAGPSQTVCASSPQVQLAGGVGGGATSGAWVGGTGTFSPNRSALNATYMPSGAEIAGGGVTLTLTSNDPTGPCLAISDQVRIDILPAAAAEAGADQTVCASSPQVTLSGTVWGGATSGTWSGGAGAFTPTSTTLNATYMPTAAEITAGGVTLTLTTNDPVGPCPPMSDGMRIIINPAATANAGADQRVCASSPQVTLAGAVGGGATSGTWSGGAGSFGPKATTLGATYMPTPAEIAARTVTLTLTTNDPAGPCPPVTDQMTITIDPVTVVSAGPDQIVCASSPRAQLQGSVSGTVSSGTWTGGAGAFSPGPGALSPTYTPTAAEIAAGSVTLTLTSAASTGPCPPASDAMTITIHRAVTANAGTDQIVCAASPQVQLAGSIGSGATSGTWSGGSGVFSPGVSTLNASYTPTAAEIAAGSVTLTLTTNDPAGPCPAVSDQMKITYDAPAVTVTDRVVCTGINETRLCANPTKGIAPYTYQWSTGATSQCIAVSDTGSYAVTITDARGCQATDSGVFRQRECIGQLAHTSTTCATFMDGTGEDLNEVHYVLKDNVITSIAPGVFFYYTKVEAPSADFTVYLQQLRSNAAFPYCEIQQDQVVLYDADCNRVGSGVETSLGQASVDVTGATVGQVFIISVKYSLKSLVGTSMESGVGVHYDFRTMVNGQVVDSDPDGLDIGPQPLAGSSVGVEPLDASGVALYRPMPNPFTSDMRMAYAVSSAGERVSIRVYDVAGRVVRVLADGFQAPGRYLATWDGRDDQGHRLQGSVFFVHVRIGNQARQVRVAFLD